jgi:hypothetical protein
MFGSSLSRRRPAGRCTRAVLRVEALEGRTLLSVCVVNSLGDTGAGRRSFGDLRYCINRANNLSGPDTITFALRGTIALSSTLPEIDSPVVIDGPGAGLLAVSGQGKHRVFQVNSTVSIRGLAIIDGMISVTSNGEYHGGAGIYNFGKLTVDGCVIRDNQLRVTGYTNTPSAVGGGVYNGGTMTLLNSEVTENLAYAFSEGSPGEYGKGGGIANAGQMTLLDSRVDANTATADDVGGLGDAAEGGGIYNRAGASVQVLSSTVDGNDASVYYALAGGAGIYNEGGLVISDSTMSGNRAENVLGQALGGAIDNYGELTMAFSTAASNVSSESAGGIHTSSPATADLHDTIVAANTALFNADLSGSLTGSSFNLFGHSQGGSGYGPNDLLNVDPKLGPLEDNGGSTPTMALLRGSPAIDSGDNTGAPEWDQRGQGYPRVVNGTIDRGAFEVQNTDGPKFVPGALTAAPVPAPAPSYAPLPAPAAPGRPRQPAAPAPVAETVAAKAPAIPNAPARLARAAAADAGTELFGWCV